MINLLAKSIIIVLLGLILFGVVSWSSLAEMVALFVLIRVCLILFGPRGKPRSEESWIRLSEELQRSARDLSPSERENAAKSLGLPAGSGPREIAEAQLLRKRRRYRPPRSPMELSAEVIGLLAFAVLIPGCVFLLANEFFSFRRSAGWGDAAVFGICIGAFCLPLARPRPSIARQRILFWAIPFVPALVLLLGAIHYQHPYLNPLRTDHVQLAADKVLSLKDNVVAADHADWVQAYARQLDALGRRDEAARYYREALRLDVRQTEAATRLAALDPTVSNSAGTGSRNAMNPLWPTGQSLPRVEDCHIDASLETLDEGIVVIVVVGEVPAPVLDGIGYALKQELGLSSKVSARQISLPPPSRKKGLLAGAQWSVESVLKRFIDDCSPFPKAPVKYLVVTDADIYTEGVNYVFSGSTDWGAVLSIARFGNPKKELATVQHRTAKQALCAVIKSYGVPMSIDRECVTSYVRSLEEFDTKGNRPDAVTLHDFEARRNALQRGWAQMRAEK